MKLYPVKSAKPPATQPLLLAQYTTLVMLCQANFCGFWAIIAKKIIDLLDLL